jgi:NADPH:quinone reductase-like Zn-dependent oxidoreductase
MVGKSKKSTNDTTLKATDTTVKEADATVVAIRKMKSLVLTSTGSQSDYSNMQVRDEDYPKCDKDDMVMVRMKAVGLNFAELMQRQGMYKPSTKTPYTPGFEGSGLVEEVSANVTEFKKDDRVLVFVPTGCWKECVCVPRTNVFRIPDEMTFEEAAGLLVNYLTAYQILFRCANVKEGDKVLIHMAAGGVGIAATQLCKTIPNVTVFGTEIIKEFGVDYPIDYTTGDYVEQIKKISPEGVDLVLDALIGEDSIKGFDLLKPLGRIVHYGSGSMTNESRTLTTMFKTWWKCLSINAMEIIHENKSISGYHLGMLLQKPGFMSTITADVNTLFKLYSDKKIKIQIDSTYGYSKVGEAMKRMYQRVNVGKIILKPDCEMPLPPVEEPAVVEAATSASVEQVKITETKTEETTKTTTETAKVEEETKTVEETKTEEEVKPVEETKTEEEAKPVETVVPVEQKIIEKTPVSSPITKPESPSECVTRE